MKTGFSQKHIELLPLDNLTVAQFLRLAIESANLLGWILGNINETGYIAYTNNGLFSWNAEIKLKIENGLSTLQSQSKGDGIKDSKENKKNIRGFISTFESLKKKINT